MSKTKEAPCVHYVCHGECEEGFNNADHNKKCQHCEKYEPRKGYKAKRNEKRRKEKEKYYE